MTTVPRTRILVVDDEVDIVRALTLRLESAGYEVTTAMDGVRAAEIALLTRPDLILLDIGMPAADGFEVIERLRLSSRTRDIPVVCLTARAGTVDEYKAREMGVDDYVTKPFDPERLLEVIGSLTRAA